MSKAQWEKIQTIFFIAKSKFLVNITNRWSYVQQEDISARPQAIVYHDCQKPSSTWLHVQLNFWTQARIHCQACTLPPGMKVKAAITSSLWAASARMLFQSHSESCCSGSSSQWHLPTNKLKSWKDYMIPKGMVHPLKHSEPWIAVWFDLNRYAACGERNITESTIKYCEGEDWLFATALAVLGQLVRQQGQPNCASGDNRRAELGLLAQTDSHYKSFAEGL